MILLLIGLILFLGIHSVRMFADDKRTSFIETRGEAVYKGIYSMASVVGLVLLIVGYQQTRLSPVDLWYPPAFMAHIAALLMLLSFVFVVAAYVPGNRIKGWVGHPMVLGVKVWAFSHLLTNGRLADLILFGSFLVWAVLNYVISRKRDRLAGATRSLDVSISRDAIVVVVGLVAWLVFAMWLHLKLIGVSPFGGL